MAAIPLALIDPDSPSFDGYESGGSYGGRRQLPLEDRVVPDTYDDDNQSTALFGTDAEPKVKSNVNSNDNSAEEVIKSNFKKNKNKNVASNSKKKSPSSIDAAAAKEKRPPEGLPSDASVAKKMKKKVAKEAIPETAEDANVAEDDLVVEKKKQQHIKIKKKKKKQKKSSVSREEMKTSDDCADHKKVEEEKKEEGGFVDVMKACERYLASNVVDWRWIENENMVKLEKMWVKLRGAEFAFRSLQADFDAELHRVALDAYILYQDRS